MLKLITSPILRLLVFLMKAYHKSIMRTKLDICLFMGDILITFISFFIKVK